MHIAWKMCTNNLQNRVKIIAFDSTYIQPFKELLTSCGVPHFLPLQTYFSYQGQI